MDQRKLTDSFKYAWEGILYCLRTQKNMRIHLAVAIIVLVCSFIFRISRLEFILVILSVSMVFTCEVINTAIEKAVDTATQEYHPTAKIAKDVAAGAVLISALNAAAVGLMIFGPKLK